MDSWSWWKTCSHVSQHLLNQSFQKTLLCCDKTLTKKRRNIESPKKPKVEDGSMRSVQKEKKESTTFEATKKKCTKEKIA